MGCDHNLGFTLLRHMLNMQLDLQSFFGLLCTAETPAASPLPQHWAQIQGRYWSAKIDDISMIPPALHPFDLYTGSIRKVSPRFSISIWVIMCLMWKNIQKLRGKILYFFTPQSRVNPGDQNSPYIPARGKG